MKEAENRKRRNDHLSDELKKEMQVTSVFRKTMDLLTSTTTLNNIDNNNNNIINNNNINNNDNNNFL